MRIVKKKGSDLKWTNIHMLDFKRIIDASGKGIGMALLQSENNDRSSLYLIAFGSKTLTSARQDMLT